MSPGVFSRVRSCPNYTIGYTGLGQMQMSYGDSPMDMFKLKVDSQAKNREFQNAKLFTKNLDQEIVKMGCKDRTCIDNYPHNANPQTCGICKDDGAHIYLWDHWVHQECIKHAKFPHKRKITLDEYFGEGTRSERVESLVEGIRRQPIDVSNSGLKNAASDRNGVTRVPDGPELLELHTPKSSGMGAVIELSMMLQKKKKKK